MAIVETDSVIHRTQNYMDTDLDDEIILLHVGSGHIYGIADTAKQIWGQLLEPIKFGKLISDLVEQFEIDRKTCVIEVSQFLLEMEKQGLVDIKKS